MMTSKDYESDILGYPTDPEMIRLLDEIYAICGRWDKAHSEGNYKLRDELTAEYHTALKKLISLGWDDRLDCDTELPDQFMPEEYLEYLNKKYRT